MDQAFARLHSSPIHAMLAKMNPGPWVAAIGLLLVAGAHFPDDISTTSLSVQRITNAGGPPRFESIATPCPECGQGNHHRLAIQGYVVFELHTVRITVDGVSSTNYARGFMTNFFTTNIVPILAASRTQPGWRMPPPLTNAPGMAP